MFREVKLLSAPVSVLDQLGGQRLLLRTRNATSALTSQTTCNFRLIIHIRQALFLICHLRQGSNLVQRKF